MKKGLFSFLILIALLPACSDETKHRVSGQWQLKTINNQGVVSQVDTVFFSFQRGAVFALTVLEDAEKASVSYGYLEAPSDEYLKVSLDAMRLSRRHAEAWGWNESNQYEQIFMVEKLTGKELILSTDNGRVFHFNKH